MTDGKSKLMQYDHLVKLLLIGDGAVGKSSLLMKFIDNKFVPSIPQTIGMDFKVKMVTLGGQCLKLQIWDTAGQERFQSITKQYYRNAAAIIMVYDVTNEKSFVDIRGWAAHIAANVEEGAERMLVGNKSDCEPSKRAVDAARGKALADEYGIPYMETSAKDGSNVEEAFYAIADSVRIRLQSKKSVATSTTFRLPQNGSTTTSEEAERWCCPRRRKP
jgi:Ras-related protein Rab-8A